MLLAGRSEADTLPIAYWVKSRRRRGRRRLEYAIEDAEMVISCRHLFLPGAPRHPGLATPNVVER